MSHLLQQAWNFLLAGGPVMWPLLLVSLWLWALILRKISWLMGIRAETFDLGLAGACLRNGAEPARFRSPRAAAVGLFLQSRTGSLARDLRLWQAAVRHQNPLILKHLTEINVLAAAAPLLGLLGTVSGMIDTFEVVQLYGTGNTHALAAGISEALITTQTGLLVAIPGMFAGYTLRRQSHKLRADLFSFQRGVERLLKESKETRCFI